MSSAAGDSLSLVALRGVRSVRPCVRGLAHILLAYISCLTSTFTADRTHILFDISGRENNTRMVKFAASVGAQRCQTFTDEVRRFAPRLRAPRPPAPLRHARAGAIGGLCRGRGR